MSESDAVEGFWRSFVRATGIDGPHTAWSFGNDPAMADELGQRGPHRLGDALAHRGVGRNSHTGQVFGYVEWRRWDEAPDVRRTHRLQGDV